jgi:hypothetical protein
VVAICCWESSITPQPHLAHDNFKHHFATSLMPWKYTLLDDAEPALNWVCAPAWDRSRAASYAILSKL